jgi:hypothetical protein
MSKFTTEESNFLSSVIKIALSDLNAARRQIAAGDNMVDLMRVEDTLSTAESAWQKVKEML